MKIRAEQKNTRQTPRKVRLVANQVKDLPLQQAMQQLALMERRAALVILKVIRQAIANATHNEGLKLENLELDNILVKTGPTLKRFRAVSRGRGHKILKRTCHVEAILKTQEPETIEKSSKKSAKTQKETTEKSDKSKKANK